MDVARLLGSSGKERERLGSQLDELDLLLSHLQHCHDEAPNPKVCPRSAADERLCPDDFSVPPGLHAVLAAQLRDAENWLPEVRKSDHEPVPLQPPGPLAGKQLLFNLLHARSQASECPLPQTKDYDDAAKQRQRLQMACDSLIRLRSAHASRRLALEQAHSAAMQTRDDFGRLLTLVRGLDDSRGGQDAILGRYSGGDVALALVNAIEMRRALVCTLSEALNAQLGVRASIRALEVLSSCGYADGFIDDEQFGSDGRYAPAARLVLSGVMADYARYSAAEEPADHDAFRDARLQEAAEENAMLWEKLSAQHLQGGLQGGDAFEYPIDFWTNKPPPTLEPVAISSASQIPGLSADESLEYDTLFPSWPAAVSSSKHCGAEESDQDDETGDNNVALNILHVRHPLSPHWQAWRDLCKSQLEYQRNRRVMVLKKYCVHRKWAVAIMAFVSMFKCTRDRHVTQQTPRGARVQDVTTLEYFTLRSVTPQGVCKIGKTDDDEPRLVACGTLIHLQEVRCVLPAYFVAYIDSQCAGNAQATAVFFLLDISSHSP